MTESITRRDLNDSTLVQAVLDSFSTTPNPRTREVVTALARYSHAFLADVRPTEAEWHAAIDFLTRIGHITTDQRQEFVLLSDVLGVSMQIIGINHPASAGTTPSTVFGPFFQHQSPEFALGDDISLGAPGAPCLMRGHVRATDGQPIAGARLETWQADADGLYDVQIEELQEARLRGHQFTDADGGWTFWSVLPQAYPIPDDGPVGELLQATGRSPMRPAHVHFMISAPGFARLTTHVFVAGDPYLDTDAVFGVKEELIADFVAHDAGVAPDGRALDEPWWTLDYDFVLATDVGGR